METGQRVLEQQAPQSEEQRGEFETRAQSLLAQAEEIMERFGADMLEAFRREATVREKVISGEWDFRIAYGWLLGRESMRPRSVPAAVRNPNSANTRQSVAGLNEREMEALDDRLAHGDVIDLR